jgi:hypothetical protein
MKMLTDVQLCYSLKNELPSLIYAVLIHAPIDHSLDLLALGNRIQGRGRGTGAILPV